MIRIEQNILKKLTNKRSVLAPVREKASLSEIFHENTKLGRLNSQEHWTWINSFLRSASVRDLTTRAYKTYSLMDRAELPPVEAENDLEENIVARRSVREYSGEGIRREELARLFYFSYGKTGKAHPTAFLRAVASGGGLYPLELYALAFDVEGLDPGIYHYNVDQHLLDVVKQGDFRAQARDLIHTEGMDLDSAALVVVITASFRRSTSKYLDRGYRMILMEAGAAAHTLSLVATSLGLGVCQVGGFLDDELSEMLGIDGLEEAPLVPILVGRKPADDD